MRLCKHEKSALLLYCVAAQLFYTITYELIRAFVFPRQVGSQGISCRKRGPFNNNDFNTNPIPKEHAERVLKTINFTSLKVMQLSISFTLFVILPL